MTEMLSNTEQAAQDFVKRNNIPGKLVVAKETKNLDFPIYGTPTLFLLDTKGVVTRVWSGEIKGTEVTDFINKLSS